MKQALRVFRHNQFEELISATDIQELDLKSLVVRCPECGEFLNFVGANGFKARKPRPAHFKHQKMTAIALSCEKRVAKYQNDYWKRLQHKHTLNRSKIIRTQFWRLFRDYCQEPPPVIDEVEA